MSGVVVNRKGNNIADDDSSHSNSYFDINETGDEVIWPKTRLKFRYM